MGFFIGLIPFNNVSLVFDGCQRRGLKQSVMVWIVPGYRVLYMARAINWPPGPFAGPISKAYGSGLIDQHCLLISVANRKGPLTSGALMHQRC